MVIPSETPIEGGVEWLRKRKPSLWFNSWDEAADYFEQVPSAESASDPGND